MRDKFSRSSSTALLLLLALLLPGVAAGEELDVLTFNVWHGLRQPGEEESRKRFPGEDPARKERRFAWQIEEIRRLDPDVLLLQEVNPNQREARKYARALGYDEIHKVTSCGLHLGALYKIPRNVNEGMAILAKPELGLRRAGSRRLSGNARCTASWGFQTRESRYVLFGEISEGGRKILLANVHMYSPAFMPPDFREDLGRLVEAGTVSEEQQAEIVEILDRRLDRHVGDVRKLLGEIQKRQRRLATGGVPAPVILGGDFNAEPGTEGLETLLASGLVSVTAQSELMTWDPIVNEFNYQTGTKQSDPVPTFGIEELIELLAPRRTIARQIDHLFHSPELEASPGRRALDTDLDGMYPSDHFGVVATLRLP